MFLRSFSFIFLLLSLVLVSQAKKYIDSEEYREFQEYQEFEEFKKWKKEKQLYGQLIQEDESTSLEENEQQKSDEFERERSEIDSSEEKRIEKQKWKKNHKNNDFGKKKDFKNVDFERKKKKHDKKIDYEKNTSVRENFEKISESEENNNDPPPINEAALMARYIVNQANWTSVATISSRKDIKSYPSANVISFSDGILGNGSGIPYMYLTPLDFTAKDMFKDNRASLMMTLAQGRYCNTKNYDPMDPRCARVILTGKIKPVKNNSAEIEIAEKAVFSRHPWLRNMPADHQFFFAKLKIASIAMLDTFGGPKFVTVKDYLHPPTPDITVEFLRIQEQESMGISSEDLELNLVDPYVILVN